MDLTEESYRDLARRSPWRWRSVHLVREGGGPVTEGSVEAWVRRPDRLRVVADGEVHVVRGATDEVEAERGTDPMWQSYDWVAMLAPVEIADGDGGLGTSLTDLRAVSRRGRETWWATVRPTEQYWPRCSCCPLLASEVADRQEYSGQGTPFVPTVEYPESHEVALDVETGICVAIHANGGPGPRVVLDVQILAVDEEYDDEFFAEPSVRPQRAGSGWSRWPR